MILIKSHFVFRFYLNYFNHLNFKKIKIYLHYILHLFQFILLFFYYKKIQLIIYFLLKEYNFRFMLPSFYYLQIFINRKILLFFLLIKKYLDPLCHLLHNLQIQQADFLLQSSLFIFFAILSTINKYLSLFSYHFNLQKFLILKYFN